MKINVADKHKHNSDKTEREAFPCGKKYQRKQPVGGGWDMGNVACFLLLLCIHKKYSYVKGHAVQHKEMKHAPKKMLKKPNFYSWKPVLFVTDKNK